MYDGFVLNFALFEGYPLFIFYYKIPVDPIILKLFNSQMLFHKIQDVSFSSDGERHIVCSMVRTRL